MVGLDVEFEILLQPVLAFCGLPRLASMLPSNPASEATCKSCSKLCPDNVAWLASMLSLKSFSSPCWRR
ncbi:hypothetical protein, partial [Xanthomonas sp. MUS 060]|uniref:hypothetical protein n=1 Tax=Xanthomonas sp. MUS 060 TaxID=1588031 RepID=UPI001F3537DC